MELIEFFEALWPMQYVFILGHMRSRSTLLAHLLGSHPEIRGYTESHIKYRNRRDLARLRWHIALADRSWPSGRWLLDTQLHNRMYIPPQLRQSGRFRAIVLVRNPRDTIRSIVRMGETNGNPRDADPRHATAYYCERLTTLTGLAIEFRDRALLVDADALVHSTEKCLAAISRHLVLSRSLQAGYRIGPYTGRAGKGDMSPAIKRGVIVDTRDSRSTDPLPPTLADSIERLHRHCVQDMMVWVPAVGFDFVERDRTDSLPTERAAAG